MRVRILLISVVLALLPNGSYAYEQTTHEDLSEAAAFSSALSKPETLSTLGLSGTINDPILTFPNSQGTAKTIRLLIRDGANFEDNNIRPRSHFFNPLNKQPLTYNNIVFGNTSPDWAIDGIGDPRSVQFSFKAAREYQWQAVANGLSSYDSPLHRLTNPNPASKRGNS